MTKMYLNFIRDPMSFIGVILLTFIIFLTIFGSYIVPNDPTEVNLAQRFLPPSPDYPLGTDHFGRCVFSRIVTGAKITLGIGSVTILAVLCIGVPIGLIAGYVGGKVDAFFMRIIDGLVALPDFILAIAIAGFLGPSLINVVLAIVLVKWVVYARTVRGIVLSEKEKEYILAARISGCSTWTIMTKHLFPQVFPHVLVLATLDIGKVILFVSSLSYLGLGAQPPTPEWGAMLNDSRPYFQSIPTLMIYPGLAIMIVVLSFNLIGDGLREVLDVKKR
jgi:peptide/nickel transport system permease protein